MRRGMIFVAHWVDHVSMSPDTSQLVEDDHDGFDKVLD